jgi:hypothetical protein
MKSNMWPCLVHRAWLRNRDTDVPYRTEPAPARVWPDLALRMSLAREIEAHQTFRKMMLDAAAAAFGDYAQGRGEKPS